MGKGLVSVGLVADMLTGADHTASLLERVVAYMPAIRSGLRWFNPTVKCNAQPHSSILKGR
jgi:hypothetical protein